MRTFGVVAWMLLTFVAPAAADTAPAAGELRLEAHKFKAPGGKIDGERGVLGVPENRSAASSRVIELPFVRLKSHATEPGPPVVFLQGGPGQRATGQADSPRTLAVWQPVLEVADVILLDQRGTTDAALRYSWDGPLPLDFFADEAVARTHRAEVGRQAAAAIRARGVDLAGYTSVESADDVDALRRALGLDAISLVGFSYGTHLALAVLRRHGEHVASAALFGVEGPDHTYKLPVHLDTHWRTIALLAAEDENVRSQVPDLVELLERVSRKLDAEPMVVEVTNRSSGEKMTLPIGRFGLHLLLRIDVGDATDIPVFPRLLASIDRGDPRMLQWFVQKRIGLLFGTNGMTMVMDAASGASAERLAAIRAQAGAGLFADVANFPFPEVAPVWDAPDLGDAYRAPLTSDVRTLFVSGALDWNTPPFQAEEVGWGFTNGTHVIVENAGHEQTLFGHPDVPRLLAAFLRGDNVAGTRVGFPPLRFVPVEGRGKVTHPSVR